MSSFDRDHEIVRRYLAGESIGAIGIDYHISRQRVFQIIEAHEVYRPRLIKVPAPKPEKFPRPPGLNSRRAVELRLNGMTYLEIAKELGVNLSVVATALRRWSPDLMG